MVDANNPRIGLFMQLGLINNPQPSMSHLLQNHSSSMPRSHSRSHIIHYQNRQKITDKMKDINKEELFVVPSESSPQLQSCKTVDYINSSISSNSSHDNGTKNRESRQNSLEHHLQSSNNTGMDDDGDDDDDDDNDSENNDEIEEIFIEETDFADDDFPDLPPHMITSQSTDDYKPQTVLRKQSSTDSLTSNRNYRRRRKLSYSNRRSSGKNSRSSSKSSNCSANVSNASNFNSNTPPKSVLATFHTQKQGSSNARGRSRSDGRVVKHFLQTCDLSENSSSNADDSHDHSRISHHIQSVKCSTPPRSSQYNIRKVTAPVNTLCHASKTPPGYSDSLNLQKPGFHYQRNLWHNQNPGDIRSANIIGNGTRNTDTNNQHNHNSNSINSKASKASKASNTALKSNYNYNGNPIFVSHSKQPKYQPQSPFHSRPMAITNQKPRFDVDFRPNAQVTDFPQSVIIPDHEIINETEDAPFEMD
jgi:hypothetical protein